MEIYDFSIETIEGQSRQIADYKGKVLLIVNTASKCGFTPQYRALENLYRDYKDRGLVILAFPCNQFANQEPGSNPEIQQFCTTNYEISFPLFTKINVNGRYAHPLYQYLKKEKPGVWGSEAIKWNFTKFLVDRSGRVAKRYAPMNKPEALADDIEQLLS